MLGDAEVDVEQDMTVLGVDTTADADRNLAIGFPDTSISVAERAAVAFAASGIDADAVSATVTFTDAAGHSVSAAATLGVVDLSTFVGGPVTSTLTVVDAVGNSASVSGPAVDLNGDLIVGTPGDDVLTGGGGDDTIVGRGGDDVLSGEAGADTVQVGTGHSVLRDGLLDLDGDTISGLGFTSTIDIQGASIGRSDLSVAIAGDTTTLSTGGSSFQLTGDFSDGDFMTVAHGTGADAHTTVSFVNYLPTLPKREGRRGIDQRHRQPVFPGRRRLGAVHPGIQVRRLRLQQRAGRLQGRRRRNDFRRAHPVLEYARRGRRHGRRSGRGRGQREFGFFLIQDGFDRYGNLPDDLSFVAPGTTTAAGLDAGTPPVLHSATHGALTAAPIFHSLATLNPGDAIQVLSAPRRAVTVCRSHSRTCRRRVVTTTSKTSWWPSGRPTMTTSSRKPARLVHGATAAAARHGDVRR